MGENILYIFQILTDWR